MNKRYIRPQELLADAFSLGWQVFESGFRPDYIIGVWRGGTPVGIAVHELLHLLGVTADHAAVRTASYSGIGQREERVQVDGLDYIFQRLTPGQSLLLVDDVHDTGLSLQQIITELRSSGAGSDADIRVATPWFKPGNNLTGGRPDYFLHQTDDWLVFPHELDGLTLQELEANKPELAALIPQLKNALARQKLA
ncbi:phosphoribosyltransferase [Pseudomonadota bacterium]